MRINDEINTFQIHRIKTHKRYKCPACGRRFCPKEMTKYAGIQNEGSAYEITTIVNCPECGMRMLLEGIAYQKYPLYQEEKIVQKDDIGKRNRDKVKKYRITRKEKENIISGKRNVMILFAVVLAIGFGVFFWNQQKQTGLRCYQQGLEAYQEKSYVEAVKLLEKGTKSQNKDCIALYAWCLAGGIGCEPDSEKAQKMVERADQTTQVYALAAQAELDAESAENKKETKNALLEYEKCVDSLETVDEELYCRAARLCEVLDTDEAQRLEWRVLDALFSGTEFRSYKDAKTKLLDFLEDGEKEKAEEWKRECLYYLGNCYWRGRGTEKDDAVALSCWAEAACMGNATALVQLAQFYKNGGKSYLCSLDKEGDFLTAFKCAKAAHDSGNAMGTTLLAECYFYGIGTEEEEEMGIELARQALDAGEGYMACVLGDYVQNETSKLKYYNDAYDKYGCVEGLERKAECYIQGKYGCDVDGDKGWRLRFKAAEQGCTKSMLRCASNYYYVSYIHSGEEEQLKLGRKLLKAVLLRRDEWYSVAVEVANDSYDMGVK